MEIELSIVMDRINSRSDFILYLKKIHAFLMKTSILGDNFANYYLQAGESEDEMDLEAHLRESTQHKVPSDFKYFFSMLTSCGAAPHEDDFYILGVWNGNMDFLTASEGDRINSFSVTVNLSASNRGSLFHDYKASIEFCFLAGDKDEYEERRRIAEKNNRNIYFVITIQVRNFCES